MGLDDQYEIVVDGTPREHVLEPDNRHHIKDVFDRFGLSSVQNLYTFCFDVSPSHQVNRLECCFRSHAAPTFSQTYFWTNARDYQTPESNMRRVIGSEDYSLFKLTGYTEYRHIKHIFDRYSHNPAAPLRTLDWGCGAARVLRHFLSDSGYEMTGADIDRFNVEYCRRTFGSAMDLALIGPCEPLPFPAATFDRIYGISVFTHLNRLSERFWLQELDRVSKPGAIIVMSIHGETAFFKEVNDFHLYATLTSEGFLDLGPCPDLNGDDGNVDEQLYRNVMHSEHYIYEHWTKHFSILDYIPAGSPGDITAHQDYVVMMKSPRPEPAIRERDGQFSQIISNSFDTTAFL